MNMDQNESVHAYSLVLAGAIIQCALTCQLLKKRALIFLLNLAFRFLFAEITNTYTVYSLYAHKFGGLFCLDHILDEVQV